MIYFVGKNKYLAKQVPAGLPLLRQGAINGITLFELVLVAAISVIVLMATATIAVNETRSSIRRYVYQSLRDQSARVTFLIEGEVGEASALSTDEAAAETAGCTDQGTDYQFKFALTHQYTSEQDSGNSTICYYNKGSDLYRFGPRFDNVTGILAPVTAASKGSMMLVSPKTQLTDISVNSEVSGCSDCDGRTLEYAISVGTDSTGSGSIWNVSYTPRESDNTPRLQVARIRSLCVTSDTSSGWCSGQ